MALSFFKWSQTASANATADPNVNWAEGQAPSSVNDSARAMMASLAGYRDDIAGAIATGGSSTAYTVTSFQVFDSLANMNGKVIAFTPNATSTNAVGVDITLSVDGLTAKPIRMQPSVALPGGTLIQGTPYMAVYNNSDGAFYLQNFTNPYSIPLFGGMDFWDTITPNSSFIFPAGQAISRTTYATAFARWGTTYGSGDGSTTFNVPDKTGRVSAMKEATATRLTTAGSGVDGGTIGANGGAQNITMVRANLPNTSATITVTDPGHTHPIKLRDISDIGQSAGIGGTQPGVAFGPIGTTGAANGNSDSNTTGISAAFNMNGNVTQTAMIVAQPTIVCNYIIRII